MGANRQHEKQAPIVKEYARLAVEYDTRWSFYIEATTRETMKRLRLLPTDRVLDVGCGTGALLHHLSTTHPAAQLSGVDPVPEMLAIARRRLLPSIELREGWAEHLPFAEQQFDVIVSCNMFHYIRKPVAALLEMKRVLRPGGQLIITDWCDDYWACRVCNLYLRLFSRTYVKTYHERECVQLLQEAGYTVKTIDRYKINWLWGMMTVKATKDASRQVG